MNVTLILRIENSRDARERSSENQDLVLGIPAKVLQFHGCAPELQILFSECHRHLLDP